MAASDNEELDELANAADDDGADPGVPICKQYRRYVDIEYMETLLCASMMEVLLFGKTDMPNVLLRLVLAYNIKLRDDKSFPKPPLWAANECTPSSPPTLQYCFF